MSDAYMGCDQEVSPNHYSHEPLLQFFVVVMLSSNNLILVFSSTNSPSTSVLEEIARTQAGSNFIFYFLIYSSKV